jgi:hypothetical protein
VTLTGDRPHLLSVYLTEGGGFDFSIACPWEGGDESLPCALWEECDDSSHRPVEPECEEPTWTTDDVTHEKIYSSDSTVEAIEAWAKYYEQCDEYDESHEQGGFHPTSQCWLKATVNGFALNDQWELTGFDHQFVAGPVAVDWDNAGSLDDSYLLILPHKAKESHADGEAVHHPADVGSA